MASPVKVKPEPAGDVFSVDTDSEADAKVEDIDIDKLQPLAPKFALLSKFPVGCRVWYNLRCSPKMKLLQAKSALVEEVSIHFENLRRVYKVKPEASDEKELSFYEDQLVFAINCPVKVTKMDIDESVDGVVVYVERKRGIDGRRQIRYAVQYYVDNYITIEPGIAADRLRYKAGDFHLRADGKECNSSSAKQQQTACTQERDTNKEEKEVEVPSHSCSKLSAHSGHDDRNKPNTSKPVDTTPTLGPASPSQRKGGPAQSLAPVECNNQNASNHLESPGKTKSRWEPPSLLQQKRSHESEPNVRPAKVTKRDASSGEQDKVKMSHESDPNVNHRTAEVTKREASSGEEGKIKRDTSIEKTENAAAVRTLTIPPWWKNQWGPENRRQLYSRLLGKTNYKSSFNCSIKIDGNKQNKEMRITIESLSTRASKSKMNSIKHANDTVERILAKYLADENSKMRLLFDLAWSDQSQLKVHDDKCGVLLHKEIYDSRGSKSKKWWHLIELMRGQDLHPDELSSLKSNLPKGGDCRIDVFGRSVKVSRESPYVLVSGTKQLDVKNAALMIRDALQLQTDGKGTKV